MLSTHSPNILKEVVRLFSSAQQVLHFSKKKNKATRIVKMNSQYDNVRFISTFSDNEARLFFSHFILFVEGATEVELFGNLKLRDKFPVLKKIDIYQTDSNDVNIKYTNPSYLNSSIPYLSLYDADALISIDGGKISLGMNHNKINKKINLSSILKRLKKLYPNKFYIYKKDILLELEEIDNSKVNLDGYKIKMGVQIGDSMLYYNTLIYHINMILQEENRRINNTTIEGVLINENSVPLFHKWLHNIVIYKMSLQDKNKKGKKEDISKKINVQKKLLENDKKSPKDVFKVLLKLDNLHYPTLKTLSKDNLHFIRRIKCNYIYEFKSYLENSTLTKEEISILYTLIFNGKTETLNKYEDQNRKRNRKGHISNEFYKIIDDVISYLSPVDILFQKKTSGWVTDFMNYSIQYIDRNTSNQSEFNEKFKFFFPEIYDTIKITSSAIDKET